MQEYKVEATDKFSCPSCGGNMAFNTDIQKLKCPYCLAEVEIATEKRGIKEHDLLEAQSQYRKWDDNKRVIHCESCGAQTVLEEHKVAQFCAFCGSSHIVDQGEEPGIHPESLIPFQISEKKANASFIKWISKKHFAPRELKSSYKINHLTGTYLPFWTYDAQSDSYYTADKGTYYYVTKTVWVTRNGKRVRETRRERRTRWTPTSGNYGACFDDVLIHASHYVNDELITKIEPFDLGKLVPYQSAYLSGFVGEKYSIGLMEGWQSAQGVMNNYIRAGVIDTINGDEVRNLNIQTSFDNITFKHILLPVWLAAYNFKNKTYHFMINGQTGEIQGECPISVWKVILLVLFCILAIGGIIGIIQLTQN